MNFWQKCSNAKKNHMLWPIGVCIGGIFLIIGFYGEQLADMYRKAVMICLECIGIG